jgi:uncharacterized protein (TIGR02301 family)
MRPSAAALCGLMLAAFAATPDAAPAQTRPAQPAKAAPVKPADAKQVDAKADPDAETPPPPYEPQLLRLSEIMGALAFLRPLCGATDGPDWRKRMSGLIDAEASSSARRDRLAGAFNKGYRGFALVYRACTPSAELAISRYLDEGGRLTRDLTTRFGG